METLNDYLDAAIARQKVKSHNKLAIKMGFSPVDVHRWRNGQTLPQDQNMLVIADAAGADPDLALLRLAKWRAPESARPIYDRLIRRLIPAASAAILAIALLAAPQVSAADRSGNTVTPTFTRLYIMGKLRSVSAKCLTWLLSICFYGLARRPLVAAGPFSA